MTQRHVAIYLRVSTAGQDLRSQRADLERWEKAYVDVDGPRAVWYVDKASGSTMDRPAWLQLEAQLRGGAVSRIVVWRLDRLGRTAAGLTSLFADLESRGVGLVSMREGVDLGTPAGRMLAGVLASLAQYEREVSRERQTAGITAARAAGKRWGGRRSGERWKVTPELERQVRGLRAAGEPVAAISRAVSLARNTVYGILRPTEQG
jgi:DNA invertase Pin-like site-specific DNA recombinase